MYQCAINVLGLGSSKLQISGFIYFVRRKHFIAQNFQKQNLVTFPLVRHFLVM